MRAILGVDHYQVPLTSFILKMEAPDGGCYPELESKGAKGTKTMPIYGGYIL